MSRLRRVCTVAAALIASAGAAAPAVASPVAGGGSFDDAPRLGAGRHQDTILPYETLFYAVELREGQRLTVRAVVDLRPGSKSERGDPDAFGGFGLTLYSPLLERLGNDSDPEYESDPTLLSDGDAARTPRALSAPRADERKIAGPDDWTGPGTYYVTATMSGFWGDLGAAVEFPLRLDLTIDGPAVPSGSAELGPLDVLQSAPATAGSHRSAARAGEHAAPAGSSRLTAGGAGLLGGALVGGLAGYVARRPARGRARPP